MRVKLLLLYCFISCSCFLRAQIAVSSSSDATALAQKIVGSGVTILNAKYKGSAVAAGFFVDMSGTLGIDSGIVLTSGRAKTIAGGNGVDGLASLFSSYNANLAGDIDLTSFSGQTTNDACILEFDFIPQGDSINVKFVFSSEEYNDYVCSQYNDVFGFLVSGPGIVGKQNIALVPNTTIPVSINSINGGRPGTAQGTNANYCKLGQGSPFPSYYFDNTIGRTITHNGYTKVLLTQLKVQPCQTYHIKLAIADGFDAAFDSGVFIEASSFSSNAIAISNDGGFTDAQNNNFVVEGCKSTQIKIKLNNPATVPITLPVTLSGTAINGIDYASVPNTIQFGVGEIEKFLTIVPLIDFITEPTETVVISVGANNCSNSNTSSVTILIKDSVAFGNIKDTFVCSKFPTKLIAPSNDTTTNSYQWSTGDTTRFTNVFVPGNNYWVVHKFSTNCYDIDTFHVVNGDPTVSIGNDVSFCNKDSVQLISTVLPIGGSFLWNTGGTTSNIYANKAGIYTLKYTATNGCYQFDDLLANVKPLPYTYLGNDTSLCSYESLTLNAFYAGASYKWSNGATSSTINIADADTYMVTSTLNGCTVSDTIVVTRKITPVAKAGADTTIFIGGQVRLVALRDPNNAKYEWFPSTYFDYPTVYNPFVHPLSTSQVYLKVSSVDNCEAFDTVKITVKDYDLQIPNTFSPNGDGINDEWIIPLLNSFIFSKVEVYNRNGQKVFNSTGYNTPWNGRQNGAPLPIGTYYYIINPGMGKPIKSGSVTILR